MIETQKMIRELKGWRRKAALELDVGIRIVKKGINAILFSHELPAVVSTWRRVRLCM